VSGKGKGKGSVDGSNCQGAEKNSHEYDTKPPKLCFGRREVKPEGKGEKGGGVQGATFGRREEGRRDLSHQNRAEIQSNS